MIMENFKEELAAALDHGWPLGAEQGEYRDKRRNLLERLVAERQK